METRTLGDYTLIKQIGQGSLGVVYLAEHRFMKKQYVIKVLPEELSSDRSFIQRFEEEVGHLTALDHPNIVRIHNISFAQGYYFLVTDCVVDEVGETTNLAQYILSKGKRLDEESIYRLLFQIADALDYAHGKKGSGGMPVVHRNLKLNNLLIAKGKDYPELMISDFGLSRVVGVGAVLTRTYKMVAEALGFGNKIGDKYPNPSIEQSKLTALHASFLQNFSFLAPEQRRLDHMNPVDAKADIYAFGILSYYLLTGEFPEGYFEMPSSYDLELSFDWDALVSSCLSADSKKRPALLIPALEAIRERKLPIESIAAVEVPEAQAYVVTKTPVLAQQAVATKTPVLAQQAVATKTPVLAQQIAATLKPVIRSAQLERPRTDPDPAAAFIIDTTVKHYTPERKEVNNIQPLMTDMVIIAGGTFYRGSQDGNRDEMPRHRVTLASFAIDIHPVTNEQFVRFLEVMGGEKDSNHQDIIRMRDSRIKRSGGKLSIESGYSKHPVVGVTWYGAIAYANWVGKRLPTEAEWEIASFGGLENVLYPIGDDIEKTQANYFSSDTTAVMSYPPNGYGLYDMAGNVYEWCYDWYGYNYYETSVQEPENPQGPLQGVYRVLRGGCWKSLKEDLRCSRRHRNNPGTVNGTYGFRCAADVQETD